MAAVKDIYLVVINTALLEDKCTVYPPGTVARTLVPGGSWSWAEEIVPKLMRQGSGDLSGPPLVIMLWNGDTGPGGHFDATCKAE